ncbi:SagB/ThcOx family dehydrogenase [Halocatena salina]|uniref:SagB/ThcOx family dehydrogenase n=1 Tax=Halocatena salina TaxID=2934340 RepID=A0A8U0A5N5_9EURY|nr:SagB/ThcOx family dehydrogenase [Halocatena salina]UPM44372.1 SagB/ThcOx family dehydrogenase [Halocatena salina]
MTREASAQRYHDRTRQTPESFRTSDFQLDLENKPHPYKIYEKLRSVSLSSTIRPPQIPTLRAITGNGQPSSMLSSPDRETITQLCYFATGITKTIQRGGHSIPFRAAACTGALYHVELYVICGPLPGLDAGVYHFDPRTLSLDLLRTGDFRGVCGPTAPFVMVPTTVWWRNAWKYRARTYRHAFWDSGTILANLLAVAHALELPAHVETGFVDEQIAELLGIDIDDEAPIALVPIGAPKDAQAVTKPPALEPIDPETRSDLPVEYELIREAYTASMLPDTAAVRTWRTNSTSLSNGDAVSPGTRHQIDLTPVGDERAVKTPLHWTIRRRGSCREYVRDSLSFSKISTILDRSIRDVPLDVGDSGPLRFSDPYLIINDVQTVQNGAYQYHPETGSLERLRAGTFRSEAAHLALDQQLAADAALCLFFLADLDAVTGCLGDRGYRVAQLEAAITAGRLYLGTYAHRDLGGTGLTFYDDEITAFFSPRAKGQTPMFLWTLGRPA